MTIKTVFGCRRVRREEGMALVTVILVTMLCAALMVGFVSAIATDQRSSGLDRDQTQAYAVAHAGLEKLTSDLTGLFRTDFSPNAAQIATVAGPANRPSIQGFEYLAPEGGSGYTIGFNADATPGNLGNPAPESMLGSPISNGPYQGFMGLITPYWLTVTARSNGGAEVRLRRKLQTVAIPVFQFGMFSETDLAFHAGEDFNFGGRVHTNGNLFLAQADGGTLTLSDRITAVLEVFRNRLPNGLATSSGYRGPVIIPTVIKQPTNTTRALALNEGSHDGTAPIGSWDSLSTGTYKSNIRNGATGARRLDLPLVGDADGDGLPDAEPIELIRRPLVNSNEDVVRNFLYTQRYFAQASVRILLSDDVADIQNLPTVLQTSQPVLLDPGVDYAPAAPAAFKAPLAASAGSAASGAIPAGVYRSDALQPLIGGYIKIEMQRQNGTWVAVTSEILGLGIAGRNLADVNSYLSGSAATYDTPAAHANNLAGRLNRPADAIDPQCATPNPDAILRLQRVRDVPAATQSIYNPTAATARALTNAAPEIGRSCGYTVDGAGAMTGVSANATDYWPNVLYDTREAQTRDGLASTDLALGGIVHYVELDMNNLRRWLLGQIGVSGTQARNENGFVVYFSDRRNNNDAAGAETGEYGYEDTVNPATTAGTPNGLLDAGEDLNSNNALEVYGARPWLANIPSSALASVACAGRGQAPLDCAGTAATTPLTDANTGSATMKRLVARANKAILFRRALKVVNGGITGGVNSIIGPGLTIASENPVYIQGNFNATSTSAVVEPNVATAVLADAVALLSNNWNDIRSFTAPTDSTGRPATTTGYRVAIVTGKTRPFPKPGFASASFGSDGGAHNFVRNLENWSVGGVTQHYRGSFVSFFFSRQATGSFKCCLSDVYLRGDRNWTFDTDFLIPSQLPPATPMFRDVNTLTFRQLLRPTQGQNEGQ